MCLSLILLQTQRDYAQVAQYSDTTLSQNLEVFSSVYRKVINTYPGRVEPETFMLTGIHQMLQTIDPFTNFLTQSDVKEFRSQMSGKYGGIGITLGSSPDGFFVREVYAGKPAQRAGLLVADMIREVDGRVTKGKSIDEVMSLLRGTPGSDVTLTVNRPGTPQETSYRLERETIRIPPVPYYGMLNEHIAYVRLLRESENCGEDVRTALKELYDNHGCKGLVFDLRGNEGGYFDEAVKIANLFIDRGGLLVRVRGKDKDTSRYAMNAADYPSLPLVLLTDNFTASSGEILAGAIQDNDRAVLIGQKTYGKGLVQVVFDMPRGTQLKLTTAHYFTPSGRCIQAFEYNNGNKSQLPDSTKKTFKTKNGREVYSNGGITPDIITEHQEPRPIVRDLLQSMLIFDFATTYRLSHPSIGPSKTFHLTDQEFSTVIDSAKGRKFDFTTETERKIAALKETALKEGYWPTMERSYSQIEKDLANDKEKELITSKKEIKKALEGEIVLRYYGEKGRYESGLRDDAEVKKAVEILMNPKAYDSLLHKRDN
jgi:carboxyl-terminal processing protease